MKEFENSFNNNVKEIIDLLSYDVYIIRQDYDVKCSCVNYDTKEGDINCPKCLGTGYKIRIKKISVASQETDVPTPTTKSFDSAIARMYYTKDNIHIDYGNIIVDNGNPYTVHRKKDYTSFLNEKVYTKFVAIEKRNNPKIFMNLFNQTMNKR